MKPVNFNTQYNPSKHQHAVFRDYANQTQGSVVFKKFKDTGVRNKI
jgi:hypothetical protein